MDDTERVRFGAWLCHAREASRLSLGEVAGRSGVTKSGPSLASLVGICHALGVDPQRGVR